MASGHVSRRDFWTSFMKQTQIFSVFRRQSCRKDRYRLELPLDISSTGTMQKRKDIPALPFLPKEEPLQVSYGIGMEEHDHEGRVITLEYENFWMVTVYTPNSQNELARLPTVWSGRVHFLPI